MKTGVCTLIALAAISFAQRPAYADEFMNNVTYSISFAGTTSGFDGPVPNLSGSGSVTVYGDPLPVEPLGNSGVVSTNPPGYNVVSGGFLFDGVSYSVYPNPEPGYLMKNYFYPLGDNVFYPTAARDAIVDGDGLVFRADNATGNFLTIGSLPDEPLGPDLLTIFRGGPNGSALYDEFGTLSITPEPSSLSLLALGCVSLGVAAFRHRARLC
jgi:hypothetical protein